MTVLKMVPVLVFLIAGTSLSDKVFLHSPSTTPIITKYKYHDDILKIMIFNNISYKQRNVMR